MGYTERLARLARWKRLTPNQRRLLMSDRRDPLEEEEWARQDAMSALEKTNGPQQWEASLATTIEPWTWSEAPPQPDRRLWVMTNQEIAKELGISSERVKQILEKALSKLRHPSRSELLYELLHGESLLVRRQEQAQIAATQRAESQRSRIDESWSPRILGDWCWEGGLNGRSWASLAPNRCPSVPGRGCRGGKGLIDYI